MRTMFRVLKCTIIQHAFLYWLMFFSASEKQLKTKIQPRDSSFTISGNCGFDNHDNEDQNAPGSDMRPHFAPCLKFIHEARTQGGRCYVRQGVPPPGEGGKNLKLFPDSITPPGGYGIRKKSFNMGIPPNHTHLGYFYSRVHFPLE